jgi:sterol desaturase/sphingolipid hydroxylase (fatty acid hydroxylase superfamily)
MDLTPEGLTIFLCKLLWAFVGFVGGKELISFYNLIIPLLVCAWILKRTLPEGSNLKDFVFPKEIWSSPSAKLDTVYYILIQAMAVLLLAPLANGVAVVASQDMKQGLESVFGPALPGTQLPNTLTETLLYTTLVFVALDFAFFMSHYLSHKLPLLWCLHKVHHSPPVLVPFTAMRFHPLDMLWNMVWGATCVLAMSAVCQYLFYNGTVKLELFRNNLFVALSYLTLHNFRHSHIWIMFPPAVSRWLISPAQHQLHHSREKRHIDKNMGYLIAVWDRLFGTLYVPTERETFRLGVHGMPKNGFYAHTTLKSLLLCPLVEAWQYLTGRQSADQIMGAAPRTASQPAVPDSYLE